MLHRGWADPLPALQGEAAQAGYRMYLPDQRPPVGGAVLPGVAGRGEAAPQHLRPRPGDLRDAAGGADYPDQSGNRRRKGPPGRGAAPRMRAEKNRASGRKSETRFFLSVVGLWSKGKQLKKEK